MVLRLDNRRVKECLHVTLRIKFRASAMANGCIALAGTPLVYVSIWCPMLSLLLALVLALVLLGALLLS